MDIARLVASRSTCLRRHVGAVLVKDKNVLATGYNGTPKGIAHCDTRGCLREKHKVPSGQRHELCLGLHAEQNAIVQAAKHGTNISGATLYCTHAPCVICAKMLINSGIETIVYLDGYPDELATALLEESGLQVHCFQSDTGK